MNHLFRIGLIIVAALLNACGPGSSGGEGTITLSITDAPIDGANKVVVKFTGVELRSSSLGVKRDFDFLVPVTLDLLNLQGINTALLLNGETVEAGIYDEIRLKIHAAEDGMLESFIELPDGQHELIVPSGAESGLKIKNDIEIPVDGDVNFTVDFSVRKSIVVAGGNGDSKVKYHLKPVLRIVEDIVAGHITGLIDNSLLTANNCSDSDADTDNAVYVFTGPSVTPDDIDTSSDDDVEPVVTALVDDSFSYTAAFLEPGEYTVAFTCNANLEDIEFDDELLFSTGKNVIVEAGQTSDGSLP